MISIDAAINDAKERLYIEKNIDTVGVKHIENRYFSVIYELTGIINGNAKDYIIKISTTERTCENEFNMYCLLASIGILSLTPVIFSERYNYLVTVKESLVDLPSILNGNDKDSIGSSYLYKLGGLLKELEVRTGEKATFSKTKYDNYVFPRIMRIRGINSKQKELITNKLGLLSSRFDNGMIVSSLVTDVNLGNLHLNDNMDFVLLDMGDAYRDDCYLNIAGVYLSLKYGPLQQYFEDKNKTETLFNSFMRGYQLSITNPFAFNLVLIRSLVCMILFIESLKCNNKNMIKSFLSIASNKYLVARFLNHLNSILEVPV